MADTNDKEALGSLSVEEALKMFEVYKEYWTENYREATIDLKMASGDRATQWGQGWADDAVSVMTAGDVYIVVNELPQYIHQVTNDIRQNTPSVKVLPDTDGDVETAEVLSDLIRSIEYKSGSDEVTDTAADYAVRCGIGFIRVDHDYCDDDGDEQELCDKVVNDPLSNWIDPASVDSDGRDSNGAISLMPINRKDFEKKYPGKSFISFTDPKKAIVTEDSIVLAEVFIREFGGKRGKKVTVHRYLFSGTDRLDSTTFPGDYIPIIPVYGEVIWIEGKRIVSGLIRQARDPQRRLNHWAKKESQILNMAPVAPVMAPANTVVNDRGQWQSPGKEMLLEYSPFDEEGRPVPQPTRLAPPPIPTGIINAMEGAKENIKESMGIYNAGLGKREGDASGIALQQLDKSGDVATLHFGDNLRRSISQKGRVYVSAIPVIYDTKRIIQTTDAETNPKMVGINGAPMQPGQKKPIDLTKGKYHVRVTTGSSYTTKRQEEAALLGEIVKEPGMMQAIGDLWAKSLDTPGSQAIAARLEKLVPPNLRDPKDGSAPPDPEKQQMAQVIQQLQQQLHQIAPQMQAMEQQLKNKDGELQVKSQDSQQKNMVELIKAKGDIQKQQQDWVFRQAELLLKDKQLDIQARQVDLSNPPENDTQQSILSHFLDEQAADNQLHRDLLVADVNQAHTMLSADQSHQNTMQAASMQPQPEQGAQQPA